MVLVLRPGTAAKLTAGSCATIPSNMHKLKVEVTRLKRPGPRFSVRGAARRRYLTSHCNGADREI